MNALKHAWSVGCIVILAVAGSVAWAQQRDRNASSEDAMKQAKQQAEQYMEVFNRGDAARIVKLYAADADRIYLGQYRVRGHEQIEDVYRKFFAENPGAKLRITLENARLLRPDVLLIEGPWTITGAAQDTDEAGGSTVVITKEDGNWKLRYVLTYPDLE